MLPSSNSNSSLPSRPPVGQQSGASPLQPAISSPLPLTGISSIEGGQAPVAQLDRALPSEAGIFLSAAPSKPLLDQGPPGSTIASLAQCATLAARASHPSRLPNGVSVSLSRDGRR